MQNSIHSWSRMFHRRLVLPRVNKRSNTPTIYFATAMLDRESMLDCHHFGNYEVMNNIEPDNILL